MGALSYLLGECQAVVTIPMCFPSFSSRIS